MGIELYEPSPLRLSPDSTLLRATRPHKLHIDPDRALSDVELENYDRRTVFYDVFSANEGRRLVAIGPPLLNMATELLPLKVRLHAESGRLSEVLKYRQRDFGQLSTYQFRVPRTWRPHLRSSDRVQIELADGSIHDLLVRSTKTTPAYLSLSTIQKDEPPIWLRQWIAYWHGLGAQRVVIYDNGSRYYDTIADNLKSLPESLNVIVVNWNFEYGPTRAFALCYAQWGALNHARLAFGDVAWHAAFDVDEYPALRHDGDLVSFLRSQRPWVGQVQLHGFNVRNTVAPVDLNYEIPTARTFQVRDRDPSTTFKYFSRPSRAHTFNVHDADTRPFTKVVADPEVLSYFHFLSLNRGWMHPGRLDRVAIDPHVHVVDSTIAEALDRLGIE